MLEKRRVVFLGDELARDLFGSEDVVGRTLQISQSSFLVVGVMQKKMQMGMYGGPDKKHAVIPSTTFKAMFTDASIEQPDPQADEPRTATRPRPSSTA